MITAIFAILALCLVWMLLASQLQRLLGHIGVLVVSRIFGIIVVASAFRCMLDGLTQTGLFTTTPHLGFRL